MKDSRTKSSVKVQDKFLPMEDILPRWLYCCLTEALLAALASMAEFDLPGVPGVEWRGEPDIEAEIGLDVTHKAGVVFC